MMFSNGQGNLIYLHLLINSQVKGCVKDLGFGYIVIRGILEIILLVEMAV